MRISLSRRAGPECVSFRGLVIVACACMLPFGPGLQAQARSNSPDPVERLRERSGALEAAVADLRSARLALEDARRRQLAGEAPLPGERTGIVGGNSRLNEAYFARQAGLRQAVEQAEQHLERAQARFNELR